MALKAAFPSPTTVPISSADARSDLAGLVVRDAAGLPRAGVLPRGRLALDLLSARNSMSVSVAAFEAVLVRNGLPSWIRNDGPVVVAIGGPPGANSRVDLVWVKQNEAESPFADANNLAVFGVTPGQPNPTPVADFASVPAGALVPGSVTVPFTATSTQSSGVVISTSGPFTALPGSPVLVRSVTERDATQSTLATGQSVVTADEGREWVYLGAGTWRTVERVRGARFAVTCDSSGLATITHGLGFTPAWVQLTLTNGASDALNLIQFAIVWGTPGSSTFQIRFIRRDTNAYFNNANSFVGYFTAGG